MEEKDAVKKLLYEDWIDGPNNPLGCMHELSEKLQLAVKKLNLPDPGGIMTKELKRLEAVQPRGKFDRELWQQFVDSECGGYAPLNVLILHAARIEGDASQPVKSYTPGKDFIADSKGLKQDILDRIAMALASMVVHPTKTTGHWSLKWFPK